jgi:hypothetical protein
MSDLRIAAGPFAFTARLEREASPLTVAAFEKMLPFRSKIIHVRWSGEATWIPMGEQDLQIPFEDPTCYPAPGQVLLYPGGVSETEILFPYGHCAFKSKAGYLPANHLMTIVEGRERLRELGVKVLWEGALDIEITRL